MVVATGLAPNFNRTLTRLLARSSSPVPTKSTVASPTKDVVATGPSFMTQLNPKEVDEKIKRPGTN